MRSGHPLGQSGDAAYARTALLLWQGRRRANPLVGWVGASRHSPPLRTVHAAFTAHGSQVHRSLRSTNKVGLLLGGSDYTRRAYLSYTSVLLLSSFRPMEPLSHVCVLSSRVSPVSRPYQPGYVFPLPFGWLLSLLETSFPPGVLTTLAGGLLSYRDSPVSVAQSP